MAKSFSDQVTDWARKSELRLLQTYRQSLQDIVEEAQKPVGSGGNMPVQTSFLRNSGDAALNRLPVGESIKPEDWAPRSWDAEAALLVINRATFEDKFFFGWTAIYANSVEEKRGFARLAAQRWPQIVNKAARTIEQRVRR